MKIIAVNVAALSVFVLFTGCATNPDNLKSPQQMTCIDIKEPMSFTGIYGLANYSWTTRLERGPYWSEKVDEDGTYYRAPPGGISIINAKGGPMLGQGETSDGGFFIPNDSSKAAKIYRYFSTTEVPVKVPPEDANCDEVGYIKDPSSNKVSLVNFGLAGAASGAAAGAIARGLNNQSGMSYGQSVGVGAAGGLIAGVIGASLVNADIGKIIDGLPILDKEFLNKLLILETQKVGIKQMSYSQSATAGQSDIVDSSSLEPLNN